MVLLYKANGCCKRSASGMYLVMPHQGMCYSLATFFHLYLMHVHSNDLYSHLTRSLGIEFNKQSISLSNLNSTWHPLVNHCTCVFRCLCHENDCHLLLQNKSTGELSFLTSLMNSAGSFGESNCISVTELAFQG